MSISKHKLATFCRSYLLDGNAARAAIAAGYAILSAKQKGWALLQDPRVKQELQAQAEAALSKSTVTPSEVLDTARDMAFLDIADVFESDGSPKSIEAMPEAARRSISSIDVRTDAGGATITKIRFTDRTAPLKLLAKVLGLIPDAGAGVSITNNTLNLVAGGQTAEGREGTVFALCTADADSQARLEEFADGRQVLMWLEDVRPGHGGHELHGSAREVYDLRHDPPKLVTADDAEFEEIKD